MIRNLGQYNHTFWGICPPTPSLSQHFALSENKVLMLVQGRGRLAVSLKHIMIQYLWRIFSCCFPLSCAILCFPLSCAILSKFFEEQWTQNHPQDLSGLSRALFPTTFLEIAVYCRSLDHARYLRFARIITFNSAQNNKPRLSVKLTYKITKTAREQVPANNIWINVGVWFCLRKVVSLLPF